LTLPEVLHKRAEEAKVVPARSVDGMDVLAVMDATIEAAARVRAGDGPQFIELRTYRFRAHSMFDPELYRGRAEVEAWKQRCPIRAFTDRLSQEGVLATGELTRIESEVAAEIEQAVAYAEAGTWEPVENLTRDVYTREPA
jgi:TPP-dependent pyruvate/acetoin dehydrogenase alpha subunit